MAMTAMQGMSEPFSNLLPPGALSNLTKYRALAADLLGCHKEVACNLDQNPDCMPHWGCHMPVVLASTTNMWLLKQNRPLTAKAGRLRPRSELFFFWSPVTSPWTTVHCSLVLVDVVMGYGFAVVVVVVVLLLLLLLFLFLLLLLLVVVVVVVFVVVFCCCFCILLP